MSVLKIQDVFIRAGGWELAASFTMQQPVTGLFGPSGAGKTTLLEIVAGLRHPSRGVVRIGDEIVLDAANHVCTPPETRRVGYVPQDLALFPHRNVRQNLLFATGRTPPAVDHFDHLVEVLEIRRLLERWPETLSGGEKRRVALGRALLSQPRLLLLDEPLVNLDRALRQNLLELLARIRTEFGTPMLYVTHEPAELRTLCDEIVLMDQGSVRAQGGFHDLFEPMSEPAYQVRPLPLRPQ